MKDVLRPILELTVILPGLLLSYFPVKSYLNAVTGRACRVGAAAAGRILYRRRTHLL